MPWQKLGRQSLHLESILMRELGKNGPPVTRGAGIRCNTHEHKVTGAPSPLEIGDLYPSMFRKEDFRLPIRQINRKFMQFVIIITEVVRLQ